MCLRLDRFAYIGVESLDYRSAVILIALMNFQSQKKRLEPLLRNNENSRCADCNSASPSWASLDFGVFVCSNCSGAHRALGPTITRIKSTTLDLWQQDWFSNMLIGNEILNHYWEANPLCYEKKPKWGSSSADIFRYVTEKYVKKRYVNDPSKPDPLTMYKQGNFNPNQGRSSSMKEQRKKEPTKKVEQIAPLQKEPNKVQNLLDFEIESHPAPFVSAGNIPQLQPQVTVHSVHGDMIDFNEQPSPLSIPPSHHRQPTQMTQHGTSFTTEHSKQSFMSFDEMISNHRNESPIPPQGLHHSNSSQNAPRTNLMTSSVPNHHNPHNMVFNAQYNQLNQHNPHFSHSPQPQVHHYNYPQQNQGAFFLKPMGQH